MALKQHEEALADAERCVALCEASSQLWAKVTTAVPCCECAWHTLECSLAPFIVVCRLN